MQLRTCASRGRLIHQFKPVRIFRAAHLIDSAHPIWMGLYSVYESWFGAAIDATQPQHYPGVVIQYAYLTDFYRPRILDS
jgi:hypothetical protein